MAMLPLLASVVLAAQELPPGWHDLGRSASVGPVDHFRGVGLASCCVDETGRWIYSPTLKGTDSVTGQTIHASAYYHPSPKGLLFCLLPTEPEPSYPWAQAGTFDIA